MNALRRLLRLALDRPLVSLLVVAAAVIGVQRLQLLRQAGRIRTLALEKVALEAAHDTTRTLNARALAALATLGAGKTAVERLVVQERQRGDALTQALGQTQVFLGRITLRLDSVRAAISGVRVAVVDDDVRVIDTTVRQAPYTVGVRAEVPAPPRTARLVLGIQQDAIALQARLGCLPRNADGIRAASLTLIGPATVRTRLDSLTQAVEVCNPPPASRRGGVPVALTGLVAALAYFAGKLF